MWRAARVALSIVIAASVAAACASEPSVTPAPAPFGWQYVTWSDPAYELAIPGDWEDLMEGLEQTSQEEIASLEPEQQASHRWFNAKIAAGSVRSMRYGEIPNLGPRPGGSLTILVESGDGSVDALVDRWQDEVAQLGLEPALTTMDTAVGTVVQVSISGQFGSWPAFVERQYLIRLPDGRSMIILISASGDGAGDALLDAFAPSVIATLRPAS